MRFGFGVLALMVASAVGAADPPKTSGFVVRSGIRDPVSVAPLAPDVAASGRVSLTELEGDAAFIVIGRPDGCGWTFVDSGPAATPEVEIPIRPRCRVEGRVVADAPIAGGTMKLAPRRADGTSSMASGALTAPEAEDVRALIGSKDVTTADDGSFVIDGICAGTWAFVARASSWIPSDRVTLPIPPPPSAPNEPPAAVATITVPMRKGWSPSGLVVEEVAIDGETRATPVAAAKVKASLTGNERLSADTLTDATGRFALHGFPSDETATLDVAADGFASAHLEATAMTPSRVVLRRLGGVRFTLADAESGHELRLGGEADVLERADGRWTVRTASVAFTDEAEIRELPPGRCALTVRVAGFLPASVDPFDVPSGSTTDIGRVALVRGHSVRGSVVDAATRQPVGGATLRVHEGPSGMAQYRGASFGTSSTHSAKDGSFLLESLPPGELLLVAEADGYADAPAHHRRVTLGLEDDDARAPLLFELVRPGELAVRLVDRQGAPVAGAQIFVTRSDTVPVSPQAQATDATGTIVFGPAAPGHVQILDIARASVGAPPIGEAEMRAGQRVEIVVTEPGVVVRGRLLRGGEPAVGVVATGDFASPEYWDQRTSTYALRDLPPGDIRVLVWLAEIQDDGSPSKYSTQQHVTLTVPPGVATWTHDIDLPPSQPQRDEAEDPRQVVINGRLVDALTGAAVRLVVTAQSMGMVMESPADAEGRFHFELPTNQTWTLGAQPPSSEDWWPGPPVEVELKGADVVSPSEPIVITATRPSRLRLRVARRVGTTLVPLGGVACRPLGDPYVAEGRIASFYGAPSLSDALGTATLRADGPGPMDVLCQVAGQGLLFAPELGTTTAAEPPVTTIELPMTGSLRMPPSLQGVVALNEPFTGRFLALPVEPGAVLGDLLSFEGDIVLRGLPPGTWGVTIRGRPAGTVTVEPGVTATIADPG